MPRKRAGKVFGFDVKEGPVDAKERSSRRRGPCPGEPRSMSADEEKTAEKPAAETPSVAVPPADIKVPEGVRATTPKERKRAFFILFVCLLSVGMGQTLVFAVLPPIAADLGMTEF